MSDEQLNSATRLAMQEVSEKAADKAVRDMLLRLGINPDDPIEAQKDFAAMREFRELMLDQEWQKDQLHLRRWRKAMDTIETKGILTGMGFMVIGVVGFVIYGVKAKIFGG